MRIDVSDVRQNIGEYLKTHYDIDLDQMDSDANLADIGVDSLGVLAVASVIENDYGISLDDERIASVRSFSDLLDLIRIKAAENV
ncbi:acyl carrier protein [Nocardia sp. BMG51109]|uniref:acyl carrier protein n=1 Tax=Nocardia sp. BMG51109 TaxID=1056816 RepID=UPI000467A60E|nr:acyl carrier protein [Nocardia sp. BMG51109]